MIVLGSRKEASAPEGLASKVKYGYARVSIENQPRPAACGLEEAACKTIFK
jgi:hypothetical protein